MSTSTAVVIGVVGLAAVGGAVYFASQAQRRREEAARLAAAKSSGGSTGDKIVASIVSALPIVGSIASLWA